MKPRILLYDIETTPIISYNWGIWDQNAIEVIEDWQIICFAYKWLGEKKIHIVSQDDLKGYKKGVNNDKEVVRVLRDLFDQADVVVAHNGDSFDQKKSQTRMMVHGLQPPSPYKQIDTKKIAKRYGAFTSNRLDSLNKGFGFEGKIDTGGFATWKGCMAGDPKALRRMKKYNKKDVEELEKLYLYLLPWMNQHPPMNILSGDTQSCPKCGKGPMHSRGLSSPSKTGRRQRFQCQNCGGWCQGNKTINMKPEYVN